MDRNFLNNIIKTPSPSGREDQLIKLVVDYTKPFAEYYIYDNQGSVSVVYNKENDFKVMLAAHADEISLVVNGYNSNGTLTVDANGGVRAKLYVGTKVRIIVDDKIVNGVVGTNASLNNKEKVSPSDLFVDIGCTTSDQAKQVVKLGSYIIHDTDMMDLQDDFVAGRAFDDRLGVFITQMACIKAKQMGAKSGIYCTATTGEETTGRGAFSSASIIKPNISLIVDVTYASDYQGANCPGDVNVGKGGVICLGSIPNRKLNNLLEECAKELELPVQFEVFTGRTGTDGDTIVKTNDGVPQVLFSIPLRYMHSPIEVASYKDIQSMIDIIALFLVKINKNYSLKPY